MSEQADWIRVGKLLEQRRVEINARYRNLRRFTDERGLDYRLAWDIEHAARTNYRRPTITAVEVGYGWQPGSVQLVLDGGDPVPSADGQGVRGDGRPLYPDSEEQKVADEVWEDNRRAPLRLRHGFVEMAITEHRRQAQESEREARRRRASASQAAG